MKDEEKNLIENLFDRLKTTELNSSERDTSADDLIQKLVKKQPASSYYMAQTILIQETAIKKMSLKIEELENKIKTLNIEESNKKPSFLSNFFKKNPISQKISHDNSIWKNKENILQSTNSNPSISPTTQVLPTTNSSRSNGFLSNALQTATGVAGGMILGNMLMNVFNHSKPEEEMFGTINESSSHHNLEENISNNTGDTNLVNYKYNESNMNEHELNADSVNHDIYDTSDTDDADMNDENFI